MAFPGIVRRGFAIAILLVCLAPPLSAQIEDQLSAYTGRNAKGYLQPLADAFGSDLNSGIFRTASIASIRPSLRLEVQVMAVLFGDDDRTFGATTERGFSPEMRVSAPTVVGSEKAVIVDGDGGTSFAFPGGFNLSSFALAVPQLRAGGFFGTEVIIRYFGINAGDSELGNISLFGIGVHHSISQYLPPGLPVDLAAGLFWQRFKMGENKKGGDLISSNALSIGVQASRQFVNVLVPYGGLSYDTHSMDLSYESDATGSTTAINVDFDRTSTLHLTLGLMLKIPVLSVFGEYNIAGQNSFSFGLGLGF
jgi:hypothetical protein